MSIYSYLGNHPYWWFDTFGYSHAFGHCRYHFKYAIIEGASVETFLSARRPFGFNSRNDCKVWTFIVLRKKILTFNLHRCKQLEVLKISTCSYVMLEHIIRSMPERVIHLEVDEISYWDWNQDNNDVLEYDCIALSTWLFRF